MLGPPSGSSRAAKVCSQRYPGAMPDRLPLVLYDGDRMVGELALAELPRSGAAVRVPIRGAGLGKVYAAALTTADGKTMHYSAEVTSLAAGQAVLTLRLLTVSGVPRW